LLSNVRIFAVEGDVHLVAVRDEFCQEPPATIVGNPDYHYYSI
jgi:hypothetical protein